MIFCMLLFRKCRRYYLMAILAITYHNIEFKKTQMKIDTNIFSFKFIFKQNTQNRYRKVYWNDVMSRGIKSFYFSVKNWMFLYEIEGKHIILCQLAFGNKNAICPLFVSHQIKRNPQGYMTHVKIYLNSYVWWLVSNAHTYLS